MTALLIAEHDNASLKDATHKALTAAKMIDGDVHILVAGADARPAAEAAARLDGTSKVLLADAPHLENQMAEPLAALVQGIASDYAAIVVPATTTGKNVAPRIAALLDVMIVSDVLSIDGPDTFQRPIYAGNAIQTVTSADPIKLVTIRTSAFQAAGEGGSAAVEEIGVGEALGISAFVSEEVAESERPELTSAQRIVSGGRALGSKEQFELIEGLADKLGAAVGASRAAVDAGYAPNDWQVGQTGKIVSPDLYVAIGISGAIQHLAGMKDAKTIVAINKDEEAPIFQIADYGLVGDLFTIIPELEAELKKA